MASKKIHCLSSCCNQTVRIGTTVVLLLLLVLPPTFSLGQHTETSAENLIRIIRLQTEADTLSVHTTTDSLLLLYRKNPNDHLLLAIASRTAAFFMQNGRWKQAIDIYLKSIEYFRPEDGKRKRSYHPRSRTESDPDPDLLSGFIHLEISLGVAYEESGLRYMAMETYRDALDWSEQYLEEKEKAMIFNNMANIYWKLGNLEKAEMLWDSALIINTRLDNRPELARNYLNLAGLAYTRNEQNQVLDYLFLAQKLLDRDKDAYLYYNTRFNTASVYERMGQTELAILNIREVIAHYEKEANFSRLVTPYLALSSLFSKTEHPDSALFYAEKAWQAGKNSTSLLAYIQTLDRFVTELHAQGKTEEAYALLAERCRLSDSLSLADTRKQLEVMEETYETERRTQQNELHIQSLEIENLAIQKRNLFLLLLILLMAGGSLVFFYKYRMTLKIKAEKEKFIQYQSQQHRNEKNILEQREQNLLESLELKNKELTSNVLRLVKNNEYAIGIGKELQQLLLDLHPKDPSKKKRIEELMINLRNLQNEGTYNEFHYYFEQVHQSFYSTLQKNFPNLNYRDLRLCAFLRLGLSTKEIATISFKTIRSVEASRNRLRKRMNLPPQENLIEFLARF